ncbi:MAG: hypothetical protein ACQEQF_00785 [Bacillota bacterium]
MNKRVCKGKLYDEIDDKKELITTAIDYEKDRNDTHYPYLNTLKKKLSRI